MRARVFPALFLLLAPVLAAGAAIAQPAQPLDRLLPQIRRDHPGQFLDAEGAQSGGNPHYRLKWLTPDGRVMYLDTDARTGRVVRQSPGGQGSERGGPPERGDEGRGDRRFERGGPPERGDEGRGDRRFERPGDAPPRGQFRSSGDGERGGFGDRFERGRDGDRFGGGFGRGGGARDFGNRGFGDRGFDGGRDRGGNRRR